jgi:two-component system, chemotaxis family, chemotaxis protein CheY
MRNLNFMIVDDSSIMIKNITFMLTELGHKVVGSARTGETAVSEYKLCKPDVITMDITMPNMGGIEAMEKILELDPNCVIIMVTAVGQEQMVVSCIAKGAKAYLIKPINTFLLKDTIEKVYNRYLANS